MPYDCDCHQPFGEQPSCGGFSDFAEVIGGADAATTASVPLMRITIHATFCEIQQSAFDHLHSEDKAGYFMGWPLQQSRVLLAWLCSLPADHSRGRASLRYPAWR